MNGEELDGGNSEVLQIVGPFAPPAYVPFSFSGTVGSSMVSPADFGDDMISSTDVLGWTCPHVRGVGHRNDALGGDLFAVLGPVREAGDVHRAARLCVATLGRSTDASSAYGP